MQMDCDTIKDLEEENEKLNDRIYIYEQDIKKLIKQREILSKKLNIKSELLADAEAEQSEIIESYEYKLKELEYYIKGIMNGEN